MVDRRTGGLSDTDNISRQSAFPEVGEAEQASAELRGTANSACA